jgi:hypothetical protein
MKSRLFNRISGRDEPILAEIRDNVQSIVLHFRRKNNKGRKLADDVAFYEPRLAGMSKEMRDLFDFVHKDYLG